LKTTLAALEFFPRERKVFLLDIYEKIAPVAEESTDAALIEAIEEESASTKVAKMGVSASLAFPPCVGCTVRKCPMPAQCKVPEVRWMRKQAGKSAVLTPYTQNPSEIWVRYKIFPELPESFRFDIDEGLGGNRAPLTTRMVFLQRHLQKFPLIEVLPKLSVAVLVSRLARKGSEGAALVREYRRYRKPEEGALARQRILQKVTESEGIFVYERDLRKLATNLSAFDAFFCAYTALLDDLDGCEPAPKGRVEPRLRFPKISGKAFAFSKSGPGVKGWMERDAVQ
ncbi:MAG: hypothetical protein AAB425_15710, partial [Bdellovibrionota bacterium]